MTNSIKELQGYIDSLEIDLECLEQDYREVELENNDLIASLNKARTKVRNQARSYRELQNAYLRALRLIDDPNGRIYNVRGVREVSGRYSRITGEALAIVASGGEVIIHDDLFGRFELVKVDDNF